MLTRQAELSVSALCMQPCGCWQLFPVAGCHQGFGILIAPYASPPHTLLLFATFICRIIKCESYWVTVVWLQSIFVLIVLSFPQSISVSGTQIRPRRWWDVPADHRVGHAEGAWQWRPDQQLQFAGFHHWWQQGAGSVRCAASCHPSVERESSFQTAISLVY